MRLLLGLVMMIVMVSGFSLADLTCCIDLGGGIMKCFPC